MFAEEIRTILAERIRQFYELQDEWDYGIEECRKHEIAIISENLDDAISFLDEECTESEYSWLSEVFEDIAEKTQSHEFIAALRRLAVKYPEETKKYNVMSFIDGAEATILNRDA